MRSIREGARKGEKTLLRNITVQQIDNMGYAGPPIGVPMPVGSENMNNMVCTVEGRP